MGISVFNLKHMLHFPAKHTVLNKTYTQPEKISPQGGLNFYLTIPYTHCQCELDNTYH